MSFNLSGNRKFEYDVVVVGGGMAGVSAAIGSSIAGKKTLLIEKNAYLGGTATNSSVAVFCGFYSGSSSNQVVKGVGEMILKELERLGEKISPYTDAFNHTIIHFDIEMMKLALDNIVIGAGVDIMFSSRMIDVDVKDDKIVSILCADDSGIYQVSGRSFVDTTGDGNLAYFAGNDVTDIKDSEVQMATLVMWVNGMKEDADLSNDALEKAIIEAKSHGMGPMNKTRAHFWPSVKGSSHMLVLPNYELKGLDALSLTDAEINTRKMANTYINAIRKYMPGMENCYLERTGPKIGIRESRKLSCDSMLKYQDILDKKIYEDCIAIGGWPFEIHNNKDTMSEYKEGVDDKGFQIPLSCLKADYPKNLWCGGRNICSDKYALASVRVMGTGLATGHASGVAAALYSQNKENIKAIRDELTKQNAIINFNS